MNRRWKITLAALVVVDVLTSSVLIVLDGIAAHRGIRP